MSSVRTCYRSITRKAGIRLRWSVRRSGCSPSCEKICLPSPSEGNVCGRSDCRRPNEKKFLLIFDLPIVETCAAYAKKKEVSLARGSDHTNEAVGVGDDEGVVAGHGGRRPDRRGGEAGQIPDSLAGVRVNREHM